MIKTYWLLLLLLLSCCKTLSQERAEVIFENSPILHGDTIVFPLTLINAYPFISAEVNGIKGKFMFDTGSLLALTINDNLVPFPNKIKSGNGNVGSGQSFSVNDNDTIAELKFDNGYTYKKLLNIKSANYGFLQDLTPDFLGFLGFNFFKGYLFKLDYLRRTITFYKNNLQRQSSKDFLSGEKVLYVINFTTRKLPNHPLVKVKMGDVEILGAFDTGQYGALQIDEKSKQVLLDKSLITYAGIDSDGTNLLTLNKITINGTLKTNLYGVPSLTLEDVTPVTKALQITEPNYMSFGYRFLEQYKTVWDFDEKKIYILSK